MKELNFRYVCKDASGGIFTFIKTIEELERAELNINTYGRIQEIISRDQYTGRKDKNNVEIYEGDKLRYSNTKHPLSDGIYLIKWSDEECGFICERQEPYNYLLPSVWHECEIIGNIIENPELVEAK